MASIKFEQLKKSGHHGFKVEKGGQSVLLGGVEDLGKSLRVFFLQRAEKDVSKTGEIKYAKPDLKVGETRQLLRETAKQFPKAQEVWGLRYGKKRGRGFRAVSLGKLRKKAGVLGLLGAIQTGKKK